MCILRKGINHIKRRNISASINNGSVFSFAVFLIMPLLFSLILLMFSDLLDTFWSFFFVSAVVLLSALGIMLLIRMVLESTVKETSATLSRLCTSQSRCYFQQY